MFGPSFAQFNPGSRRGGIAPAPIILGTSGLRTVQVEFPHANIIAGTSVNVPGTAVAGMFSVPVYLVSEKNLAVAYAPTNATFSLRYSGIPGTTLASLTPVVTTLGTRYDSIQVASVANLTPSAVKGVGLVITPSAVNGNGSATNRLRFTVAYILVRAL